MLSQNLIVVCKLTTNYLSSIDKHASQVHKTLCTNIPPCAVQILFRKTPPLENHSTANPPLLLLAVTRGTIHGIENIDDLEVTQLTVRITKLIRRTADDDLLAPSPNSVRGDVEDGDVVIEVPQHCGAGHGTGEFVFMARRKLGALRLRCAPRLEEWAAVVASLSEEDGAHCVLRS